MALSPETAAANQVSPAVRLTPNPRRVLVKEVNWLGDVVMSLPALRAVRRAFPDAALALLVKHELASFFDGSQWIDSIIPYSVGRGRQGLADRRRIIAQIRAGRFDLAVLFPNSFAAAFWAVLGRVPRRAGFVRDARGLLLTHKTALVRTLRKQHQVHDYLYMLRQTLGINGNPADCVPDVHPPHRVSMQSWLLRHRSRPRGRLIALGVAAAYGPAKEWPAAHYAKLIDQLAERYSAECVLIGAAAERATCERVATASRNGALVAAGETTVGQMIALLSLCDGFAGNDSGAMHVAAALGLPTVGIFGSTDAGRTGPLGAKTIVVSHELECSPCLQRTCRFGHYNCLTQITSDEVLHSLCALGALE